MVTSQQQPITWLLCYSINLSHPQSFLAARISFPFHLFIYASRASLPSLSRWILQSLSLSHSLLLSHERESLLSVVLLHIELHCIVSLYSCCCWICVHAKGASESIKKNLNCIIFMVWWFMKIYVAVMSFIVVYGTLFCCCYCWLCYVVLCFFFL
jgi:hypothetical protein